MSKKPPSSGTPPHEKPGASSKPAASPPAAASQAPVAGAPGVPVATPEDAVRGEVLRLLRGPIAQTFKGLMPELANAQDPYATVLGNLELLDRAFKLFAARRDAFAAFLVDAKGAPVTEDSKRLVCGRSVNEVVAMTVRSGMRGYAEQHFGETARPAPVAISGASAEDARKAGWIAQVAAAFRQRHGRDASKAKEGDAARFYKAIRDMLDYPWQVPFFPIYVEIPVELFEKAGIGITRLDDIEKLQRLARIAGEDIGKAERVVTDPELAKEMLENNPLAVASVSKMTAPEFDKVHGALAHLDTRQKWDVFGNTLTAVLIGKDKRITKQDVYILAEHLNLLNEYAVRIVFDLRLGAEQFARLLETAIKVLGRGLFLALFGPIPFFGTDDAAAARRKSYATYVEATIKELIGTVQELVAKFQRDTPEVIPECVALVCQARRERIAFEFTRLMPEPA